MKAIPRWTRRALGISQAVPADVNRSFLETEVGLDTAGLVSQPTLTADGTPYYGVAPSIFSRTIERMNIDPKEFVFIDLGSGKGRALFLAAAYPFRRIIGVEVSEELHKIAQKNISLYHATHPDSLPIESVLSNVTNFQLPDCALLIYLNNPFGKATMTHVIANIREAHRATGQRVEIAYSYPVLEALLDRENWLTKNPTAEFHLSPEEAGVCVLDQNTIRVAFYSLAPTCFPNSAM